MTSRMPAKRRDWGSFRPARVRDVAPMEPEGDLVGRLRAGYLLKARGIQHQQKGRGRAGVQHHGEDYTAILVRGAGRLDEHRFTWIAAVLVPARRGAAVKIELDEAVEEVAGHLVANAVDV